MIFPISNSTMSAIPPLMTVNPFEEPEFCFPAEDLSWDYSDMDTSDYSDVDTSGYLGSSDSEFEPTLPPLSSTRDGRPPRREEESGG